VCRRAEMVADTLNTIPGYHCNTVQGAMYAFPRVKHFFWLILYFIFMNKC
jgi:aspartate/methionine/tyrosine aminotransferase